MRKHDDLLHRRFARHGRRSRHWLAGVIVCLDGQTGGGRRRQNRQNCGRFKPALTRVRGLSFQPHSLALVQPCFPGLMAGCQRREAGEGEAEFLSVEHLRAGNDTH